MSGLGSCRSSIARHLLRRNICTHSRYRITVTVNRILNVTQSGGEQSVFFTGIARIGLAPVGKVARHNRRDGRDTPRKQALLKRIEVLQTARLRVFAKVFAKEPLVHEFLQPLVPQVRRYDGIEERTVLFVEEEVELVRSVLAVKLALLVRILLRPVGHESKLGKDGIVCGD